MTNQSILVRPYVKEDREQLVAIFRLNVPAFFAPNEVKDFEEYLDRNPESYLSIEYNGSIRGGTGYQFSSNNTVGHITWIFFHPDTTGKGLGKQAVHRCFEIFNEEPSLQKLVVTTSQLAFKFFEKFGFNLVRTEADYWGPGLDLYVMEMEWVKLRV